MTKQVLTNKIILLILEIHLLGQDKCYSMVKVIKHKQL